MGAVRCTINSRIFVELSCPDEAGDNSLTTIFYGPFGAVCDDIADPTDLHA
jgi:hypothetical protein